MSDKELVLEVIQRLPKSATMRQIRERVEFLAAIKEGEESLDRGEGVPHEEVEKRFATWGSASFGQKRSYTISSS